MTQHSGDTGSGARAVAGDDRNRLDSRTREEEGTAVRNTPAPAEIATHCDASVAMPASRCERHPGRWRPIPVTLFLSALGIAAYAAYERIGTTANADSVEFTRNLAGGFLALGMTDEQPGFIVLSALDQDEVEVTATRAINRVAGMHTFVEVQTPRVTTRVRLRGPQVMMVSGDGSVERHDVDWTVAEFNALREAADCSHEAAVKKHRCGAPFTDLQESFSQWRVDRVPEGVHAFLAPFKDHRIHQ